MDRRINVLLPEPIWRALDPNNKSADARSLMADGIEYRKIKKKLVERAFQLEPKEVPQRMDSPVSEHSDFYSQTSLEGVFV